ncbi:MAG: hypothetical protein PHI23_04875, partial [Candidatus Peribacteraceae bacterium]|nr:hypothetical protein [Candidatus Peribacteraceae bacterium]
ALAVNFWAAVCGVLSHVLLFALLAFAPPVLRTMREGWEEWRARRAEPEAEEAPVSETTSEDPASDGA